MTLSRRRRILRTSCAGALLLSSLPLQASTNTPSDPLHDAVARVFSYRDEYREPLPPAAVRKLEEDGIDEHEAVLLTLLRHPDITIAEAQRLATEADLRGARLYPNPWLQMEAEEVEPGAELGGAELNFLLRQQILTGGRFSKRVQTARRRVEVAGWAFNEAGVTLAAEARSSFLRVLASRELVSLSREQEGLAGELASVVSKRVAAGATSLASQLRAEVFVADTSARRARAEATQEVADIALRALLVEISRDPRWTGSLPDSRPPPSPTRVERLLTDTSPTLARLQSSYEAARASHSTERARRNPNVTVGLGVRRDRASDDTSYLATLGVPLPVSDRNQGGIQRAKAGVLQAKAALDSARLRLGARARGLVATLAQLHHQCESFRTVILPKARKALALSRTGFRSGKFPYINVLDAQRELSVALRRELALRLEYSLARVQLEALLGYPGQTHLEGGP